MIDGRRIVTEALKYKDLHEFPMGSNTGPFVLRCQRATWLSGTNWPWCAAFVCFVAQQCGVPMVGANSAGAHDLANRHKASWQTFATALPGDVIDYNIGSGHTGILVSQTATTVTTIDGNFGDKVTLHTEPKSLVRAVWRIPGVQVPAPPVVKKKLPPFVVATSVNGTRKVLFTSAKKSEVTAWMLAHVLSKLAPNGITIRRGPAR